MQSYDIALGADVELEDGTFDINYVVTLPSGEEKNILASDTTAFDWKEDAERVEWIYHTTTTLKDGERIIELEDGSDCYIYAVVNW